MPVEVNWTLGDSGTEIYDVTQEATRVTSGDASNLLNDCAGALWIAGDPPQYVTLRLRPRHPPLRYAGWHAWHDYLTNPRTVEIACGSNPHTLVPVLLCRALPGAGTQIWQLPLPIPPEDVYVRFTILDTFGAGPTYVNNLVLMANDPGPRYCASRSNSSSSECVAISASHPHTHRVSHSNSHRDNTQPTRTHENDTDTAKDVTHSPGDDVEVPDTQTATLPSRERSPTRASAHLRPGEAGPDLHEKAHAPPVSRRVTRLPSPTDEAYDYHNLRLSSSSRTSSSGPDDQGSRTPAGYVTTSSNPARGAHPSYGAEEPRVVNARGGAGAESANVGTSATHTRRSLPAGAMSTPATRVEGEETTREVRTPRSDMHVNPNNEDIHAHNHGMGKGQNGTNNRNGDDKNSGVSAVATTNTSSVARTTDTSMRMHRLLRELDEDIRMLKPIKPVDARKNMLVYVPPSVPPTLTLCEQDHPTRPDNRTDHDNHDHDSSNSNSNSNSNSDGDDMHPGNERHRGGMRTRSPRAGRTRPSHQPPPPFHPHRHRRHSPDDPRTGAHERRRRPPPPPHPPSLSSDSSSRASSEHEPRHGRDHPSPRRGEKHRPPSHPPPPPPPRIDVSTLTQSHHNRIRALEHAMTALTQSIRHQNDDLTMIKRLLFQHAHEERRSRQRRGATDAHALPRPRRAGAEGEGGMVNAVQSRPPHLTPAPHYTESNLPTPPNETTTMVRARSSSGARDTESRSTVVAPVSLSSLHTPAAAAASSASAHAPQKHHISIDFPEVSLRTFVERVLEDRLGHQFRHAERRTLRHLDAQLATLTKKREGEDEKKRSKKAAEQEGSNRHSRSSSSNRKKRHSRSSSSRGKRRKKAAAAGEEATKTAKRRSHRHRRGESAARTELVSPVEEADTHEVEGTVNDTAETNTREIYTTNDTDAVVDKGEDEDGGNDEDAAVADVYNHTDSRRSDSRQSDSYRPVVTGVFNAVQ